MKHAFYLVWIVLVASCGKDPKISLSDDYWGEASAERNGKEWTAHPSCWISLLDQKNLVVVLDSLIENYYLKETLEIVDVPPIVGTYKVHRITLTKVLHSSLIIEDDDLTLGSYDLLEADTNTNLLTLTSYDTLTKEIRGTFDLTFVTDSKPYSNYPDTLRFKNGKFHGKLIKK